MDYRVEADRVVRKLFVKIKGRDGKGMKLGWSHGDAEKQTGLEIGDWRESQWSMTEAPSPVSGARNYRVGSAEGKKSVFRMNPH